MERRVIDAMPLKHCAVILRDKVLIIQHIKALYKGYSFYGVQLTFDGDDVDFKTWYGPTFFLDGDNVFLLPSEEYIPAVKAFMGDDFQKARYYVMGNGKPDMMRLIGIRVRVLGDTYDHYTVRAVGKDLLTLRFEEFEGLAPSSVTFNKDKLCKCSFYVESDEQERALFAWFGEDYADKVKVVKQYKYDYDGEEGLKRLCADMLTYCDVETLNNFIESVENFWNTEERRGQVPHHFRDMPFFKELTDRLQERKNAKGEVNE